MEINNNLVQANMLFDLIDNFHNAIKDSKRSIGCLVEQGKIDQAQQLLEKIKPTIQQFTSPYQQFAADGYDPQKIADLVIERIDRRKNRPRFRAAYQLLNDLYHWYQDPKTAGKPFPVEQFVPRSSKVVASHQAPQASRIQSLQNEG